MIKFLIVVSSVGGGGAERVAVNLAAELVSRAHVAEIYCWDDKGERNYELDGRVEVHNPPSRLLPVRIRNLRSILAGAAFDVMISFAEMPNIVAWAGLLRAPTPPLFVASVHTDLRARDAQVRPSVKQLIVHALHKRACAAADAVVAVSDGARLSLIGYFDLEPRSVTRIYNPVLAKSDTRTQIGSSTNRQVRLVAAGRLTRAKNYPTMIKTMKLLTEQISHPLHLDIYGAGELHEQLQGLIDELNLSSVVTLHGFVSNLRDMLNVGDVFVQASDWEGFGNVLVEALHEGMRLVVTDCPSGPREILADGKFGVLVPMNSAQALADGIVKEITTPMVIDATELQKHLEQFTISGITDEYLSIVDGLMS